MALHVAIDYLAVLVASIVSFVFGWLWYGPLFGKMWAYENKVKMEKKPKPVKLFSHFLTTVLLVMGVALLFNGVLASGIILAVVVWVGFFLSTKLGSMIWMKQSWKLFYIDMAHHLVNLMLIVVVLHFF